MLLLFLRAAGSERQVEQRSGDLALLVRSCETPLLRFLIRTVAPRKSRIQILRSSLTSRFREKSDYESTFAER